MDDVRASGSPTLAGRYELGALLGHGGMGAVREAVDLRLRRPVAVKLLRADLAEQPRARRRFETEARAAARLSHPNVVTVFDSGEDDGIPFLVMERLPGRTLADDLAAGPLPLERVLQVGREILSALEAAHRAGIVHRDIKPGNVLLTEDAHAKVGDFGIAKTADDLDQTQTVELVATPGYLAPERLAGEAASQRSDLYSVGVLLYEALAGRRPFEDDNPLAVMLAIERGHAAPLTSLRPMIPIEVAAAVERAMSLDPRDRFDSAADMAAALEQPAELDATVPVHRADAPDTVPVGVTPRGEPTRVLSRPAGPVGVRARRRGRHALRLGVAALLAFAVAAGVGVAVHEHDQGHASAPPPASSNLPAPLDRAIRGLENAVAK